MNNKLIFSFIWKFLERASTQVINLIIQIVLARLIAPSQFGALSILIVFVNIANIFVQKGFSSSLIRKKTADEDDFNTAFVSAEAVAAAFYIVLFFAAPFIADLYKIPELKSGLRIIALQLLFGAVYCVQNAILVRQMQFKKIFIRGLVASVVSGTVGIFMAYWGFGIYALIMQSLLNQILSCLTVWFSVKWKPRFRFSKDRFKEIFSFGSRILISELLSYGVESLRTLLIGKRYSEEQLSYYDRGQVYPATLMRGIYDSVSGVLLPKFSSEQDNTKKLSRDILHSISIVMFMVFPVFTGMAAVAEPLIKVLLTDKWLPAVPFFMLFCFYQITYPVQGIYRQSIYAIGRSDIVLKLEIAKAVISIITLLIAIPFGVMAIAVSAVITMFAVTVLSVVVPSKLIGVKPVGILKITYKSVLYSLVMFVSVYAENFICINDFIKLILQLITGAFVYILMAVLFKDTNLKYLFESIKLIIKKFRRN